MPEELPQDQPINGDRTEDPSPSSGAAASSTASSAASPPSGGPFVGDPGTAFDPRQAPPAPELEDEPEEVLAIEWEEDQVRRWLMVQGELGHALAGVGDNDWKYTEADLVSIAGPLSRILNRYEPTRAAAAYSDPASVIFGFSMYTIRSAGERRKALAQLRSQEEVPITGEPAPAGSGPPTDTDWKIH